MDRPYGCPEHVVLGDFSLFDEFYSMNVRSISDDLSTLAPGKFLSDKVFGRLREHLPDDKCFIIDSQFSALLHSDQMRSDGYTQFDYGTHLLGRSFRKRTGEPIKILCIVNQGNKGEHWTLLLFDTSDGSCTWFDSCASFLTTDHDFIEGRFRKAISKAAVQAKWRTWSVLKFGPSLLFQNCPQQKNGFDCGVFVCVFIRYLVQDKGFLIPDLPTHMTWFRKLFFVELSLNMCYSLFPRLQ
jgi:hypothetical protein